MTLHSSTRQKGKIKYALKFISGELAGKEFPLPEGSEIYIGRNPELDIVLLDDLVSREHAKIVCRNGVVEVFDLGSTNGTYLYAERINHAVLREGDRLIIGASILQLVKIGTSIGLRPAPPSLLDEGSQPIMKGHLEELPLIDLLQMLHINKKSGVVVVAHSNKRGAIFLQKGNIVFAAIEGSRIAPLKALYRMIAWQSGSFEFGTTNRKEFDRPISMPTQTVLMESIKHNQALEELKRQFPLEHQSVQIPRPLVPSLADLNKEMLRFLQIAHNAYKVSQYLDDAPASDVDAYRILIELIRQGYLEVVKT